MNMFALEPASENLPQINERAALISAGLIVVLGGWSCAVDLTTTVAARARIIGFLIGPDLVACGHTALWIYTGIYTPDLGVALAVAKVPRQPASKDEPTAGDKPAIRPPSGAGIPDIPRADTVPRAEILLQRSRMHHRDIHQLGFTRLTSPERTALDLIRLEQPNSLGHLHALIRHGLTYSDVLGRARNLHVSGMRKTRTLLKELFPESIKRAEQMRLPY
ncbi:MAG: hypothetical protein GX483_07240 [Actinomycetaceae bacterium]|nr:hypothetical protein [Actinomycetaceae bacterium]